MCVCASTTSPLCEPACVVLGWVCELSVPSGSKAAFSVVSLSAFGSFWEEGSNFHLWCSAVWKKLSVAILDDTVHSIVAFLAGMCLCVCRRQSSNSGPSVVLRGPWWVWECSTWASPPPLCGMRSGLEEGPCCVILCTGECTRSCCASVVVCASPCLESTRVSSVRRRRVFLEECLVECALRPCLRGIWSLNHGSGLQTLVGREAAARGCW